MIICKVEELDLVRRFSLALRLIRKELTEVGFWVRKVRVNLGGGGFYSFFCGE